MFKDYINIIFKIIYYMYIIEPAYEPTSIQA